MATIKGKWRWNDVVNCDYQAHNEYHLNFESNKIKFDALKLEWYVGKHELYYRSLNDKYYILAGISANSGDDFYSVKEEYRVMDFGETEQEISNELYEFIRANATEYSPIADKLVEVANNVEKVFAAGKQQGHGEGYESGYDDGFEEGKEFGGYNEGFAEGKKAEYDAFWDAYQDNGKRIGYAYAFGNRGWTEKILLPKYNIIAGGNSFGVFYYCGYNGSLKELLERQGITLSFPNATNISNLFIGSLFTEIGILDFSSVKQVAAGSIFQGCGNLHTIEKVILSNVVDFTYVNWFYSCPALANITFEGTIANDISFVDCTKLTQTSITSIVNALSDSATGKTLTLSKAAVNKAFETSEGANDGETSQEWDSLEGLKTNWEITLV